MSWLQFHWKVLKNAISEFVEDDIFTAAAALSYYTIFSLPPILLIVLSITKIYYGTEEMREALFPQIEELVGKDSAQLLVNAIDNIHVFEHTIWATILSIGILIFTSTTVLVTMKNVLNKIFNVKPEPKRFGFLKRIKDRVLSFALLVSFALILLISLVINAAISAFDSYLEGWIIGTSTTLTLLTSSALSFVVITLLIAMIFKFLPDIKLKWRDTWFGAILTSLFFELGKHLISFYIGKSNVAGLYDAAGSIMVIMVWIFFASLIILFGAVFTYTRMKMMGNPKQAI